MVNTQLSFTDQLNECYDSFKKYSPWWMAFIQYSHHDFYWVQKKKNIVLDFHSCAISMHLVTKKVLTGEYSKPRHFGLPDKITPIFTEMSFYRLEIESLVSDIVTVYYINQSDADNINKLSLQNNN